MAYEKTIEEKLKSAYNIIKILIFIFVTCAVGSGIWIGNLKSDVDYNRRLYDETKTDLRQSENRLNDLEGFKNGLGFQLGQLDIISRFMAQEFNLQLGGFIITSSTTGVLDTTNQE